MSYARPIFPVALSIESAAKALGIPAHVVRSAVYSTKVLPAFKAPNGGRVRVLVRDIEAWVRTWPRQTVKRQIRKVGGSPHGNA